MPRSSVEATDIAAAIATALNNASNGGGTLKAVKDGSEVRVVTHSDLPSNSKQFSGVVH